jgi:hypothetical protein
VRSQRLLILALSGGFEGGHGFGVRVGAFLRQRADVVARARWHDAASELEWATPFARQVCGVNGGVLKERVKGYERGSV